MINKIFTEYRISDIGQVIGGGTPSTSIDEYWNGNIPWISPKDLTNYNCVYISCGENFISEKGLNKSGTKLLPENTVLFSSRAPIGYVAIAANSICTNQGFKSIICDPDKVDYLYLYYYLKANLQYIKLFANGATFPELSGKAMKNIKINIFNDVKYQRKIADTLFKYDNLIENNNKRIKLLEQMAENLYKEWFVRFRFPGYENAEFENRIPKDWNIKSISEIAEINAGGDAPKEFSLEKTKEYSIPIYSNGIKDDGLYGYSNKATIKDNGITISARGTVGFVCLHDEPYLPIVRLISVHSLEIPLSINWLFLLLKNDIIEGYGTSQQQITVPYFKRKKILVPTEELICNFYEITKPIFSEKKKLKIINTNLIKQRDLLLPRLMSGKLEVE